MWIPRIDFSNIQTSTLEHRYDQGQIRRALLELESLCHPDAVENKREQARALLLHTEWQQRSGRTQGESVISQYRRVLDWRPNWARAHFVLGNYYDWLLTQQLFEEQKSQGGTMSDARVRLIEAGEYQYLLELMNHYGRALECSGRQDIDDMGDIVYRALPRLLTLWLEFGRSISIVSSKRPKTRRRESSTSKKKSSSSKKNKLEQDVNDILERFAQTLPVYMLYTALPQLVASVGHGSVNVWTILRT